MDKIIRHQYLASLIVKEQMGILSEDETKLLTEWLNEDERHVLVYERLKKSDLTKYLENYHQIDVEKGLRKYKKCYSITRKPLIYHWVSIAAVFVILFGSGSLLFLRQHSRESQAVVICPGSAKAELILSDGSVRYLEQIQQEEKINMPGMVIHHTGTQIQYTFISNHSPIKKDTSLIYNELKTPVGGEYKIVMADGTKVWLNSQTRLRFPVNFNRRERTVYLEGEAYFEVSRDENRPFCVRMKNDVDVQVLGTSFNIKAYADEDRIETVLEEGSVKIVSGIEKVMLTPGQRSVYRIKNRQIQVENVDAQIYTAWKEGQFIFDNEPVENIMRQLARWYDVNVFYQSEQAKDLLFSGDVKRYDNIDKLLSAMEASGVIHFKMNDRTIIVSCK